MTDRDRRYRQSAKGKATEARRARTECRREYVRVWARDRRRRLLRSPVGEENPGGPEVEGAGDR